MNIRVTPNIATMTTRHRKTRAYLYQFKLLDNATCVCKQGDQTVDHLITKFRKPFITFIESTDFDLLYQSWNQISSEQCKVTQQRMLPDVQPIITQHVILPSVMGHA